YLPALLWLVRPRLRRLTRRDIGGLALAAAPAWGWLIFALVYYGFPFPNTYYAKVHFGAPKWLQVHQGLAYLASSVRFDPTTMCTIVAAVGVCLASVPGRARALVAGAAFYVFYTIWVGGDFMAGRFFSLPFLIAALLLAWIPKQTRTAYAAAALLVILNL